MTTLEDIPFVYDENGDMRHAGCGEEILYIDGGWICGCGQQWDDDDAPDS